MTSTTDPALLAPPVRPLGQRLFDFALWGGIIVLVLGAFLGILWRRDYRRSQQNKGTGS